MRNISNYLGSITDDARCALEIKSSIAMAKEAFNRTKNLFTCKLDLNLKEEASEVLRLKHSSLCCAETWTLRKIHQKYPVSSGMWC
jgi:hypothetical protein